MGSRHGPWDHSFQHSLLETEIHITAMCTNMCMRVNVCMCVSVNVCACVCVQCMCVHVHACVSAHVCMYECMYVCVCMYVCMYVCKWAAHGIGFSPLPPFLYFTLPRVTRCVRWPRHAATIFSAHLEEFPSVFSGQWAIIGILRLRYLVRCYPTSCDGAAPTENEKVCVFFRLLYY